MAVTSFTPNTQISSSAVNANFSGLADGTLWSTSAIKLGYAQITSSVTGLTSESDVTGLSATVTVPSGGRDVLVIVHIPDIATSANSQRASLAIKESTTVLSRRYQWLASTNGGNGVDFMARISAPSAGSHTYKVTAARDVGAGTIDIYAAGSGEQAWILVLAI